MELFEQRVGAFGELVAGVPDWSAPSPVPGWTARDVVGHLIYWPAAFLAGAAGIVLPDVGSVDVDPAGAWAAHVTRMREVLVSSGSRVVGGTPMGEQPLGALLDQIYVSDVFLHSWDLARAAGLEPPLDEATCEGMLAGMEPIEEILRSSGHYGPRVAVAAERSAVDRLMGFIGRDPDWVSGQG